MRIKFPFRFRKGQSLLESLLALSALTMGLLGIVSLLAQSFTLNRTISDQLVATYLAGEGIELARDVLYHDVFSGAGWNQPGSCMRAGFYDLDFETMTASQGCVNSSAQNSIKPLYFDPVMGMYGGKNTFPAQDNAIKTKFTRYVQISYPGGSNGQEAIVSAIVQWDNTSFTAEDHFYNWHP